MKHGGLHKNRSVDYELKRRNIDKTNHREYQYQGVNVVILFTTFQLYYDGTSITSLGQINNHSKLLLYCRNCKNSNNAYEVLRKRPILYCNPHMVVPLKHMSLSSRQSDILVTILHTTYFFLHSMFVWCIRDQKCSRKSWKKQWRNM